MRAIATWSHESFCVATVLSVGSAAAFGGTAGFALHYVFFGIVSVWLDWLISPTTQGNLDCLAAHGYPTPAMLALMLFNMLGTNALVVCIEILFGCFDSPWRLDAMLLLAVGWNQTLSDLTFTAGHWRLYTSRRLAPFHVIHHLCSPALWSSNLPSTRLTWPSSSAARSPRWPPPTCSSGATRWFSVAALHVWYALDQSENMKVPQSRHHKYVEAIYTVYAEVHFPAGGRLGSAAHSKATLARRHTKRGARTGAPVVRRGAVWEARNRNLGTRRREVAQAWVRRSGGERQCQGRVSSIGIGGALRRRSACGSELRQRSSGWRGSPIWNGTDTQEPRKMVNGRAKYVAANANVARSTLTLVLILSA